VICKGTRVIFELASGEDIKPPAAFALGHDPSGKEAPARYVYCGPYTRGGRADQDEVPDEAWRYLGRAHVIHCGSYNPPKAGPWAKCGEVAVIYYVRGGKRAPGGMRHKFNRASLERVVLGRGKVTLSKCGRWYRLELPKNARVDERGFFWP
jgi:hypothetical protein